MVPKDAQKLHGACLGSGVLVGWGQGRPGDLLFIVYPSSLFESGTMFMYYLVKTFIFHFNKKRKEKILNKRKAHKSALSVAITVDLKSLLHYSIKEKRPHNNYSLMAMSRDNRAC